MPLFKLLGTAAMLVTLAAQSQTYGTEGREVAAPPWSAACTNDQGPTQCGEPMWIYGALATTPSRGTVVGRPI
jgi:hypothetical protein